MNVMQTTISSDIASFHNALKRLSKRFTRDADESSDLVQDTMLRALAQKHKFTENNNLQGWLFTIMRNTFINHYRKRQRGKTFRDTARESFLLNVEDPHTFSSGEKTYAWAEMWKQVDSLKEELRIPFELHTSGYKYHEIGAHLNIPIGTVKNRIFHARKELQRRLV